MMQPPELAAASPSTTVGATLIRLAATANGLTALRDDVCWSAPAEAPVAAETDRLAALLRSLLLVLLDGGHRVDARAWTEGGRVTFELRRCDNATAATARGSGDMAQVRLTLAQRVAELFAGVIEVDWSNGEPRNIWVRLPAPV